MSQETYACENERVPGGGRGIIFRSDHSHRFINQGHLPFTWSVATVSPRFYYVNRCFSGGGQKRIVTKLSNILFVQIHRIQIFVQIVLQYRFKISKRI